MPKVDPSEKNLAAKGAVSLNNIALSPEETLRLLAITVDLVTICARLSRRINPAAGAMMAYARDELLEIAMRRHSLRRQNIRSIRLR
jgi:hypothetical protein